MKYNKALDFLAVASQEFQKGNKINAARIFAAAVRQPSMNEAIRIIEANNRAAFPKIKAEASKKRSKIKAEAEIVDDSDLPIEETDEDVEELLRSLGDEEAEAEVEASDDDEDDGDDDEEVEEIDNEEIEEVVARMRANRSKAKRKVTASQTTFAKVLKTLKG